MTELSAVAALRGKWSDTVHGLIVVCLAFFVDPLYNAKEHPHDSLYRYTFGISSNHSGISQIKVKQLDL